MLGAATLFVGRFSGGNLTAGDPGIPAIWGNRLQNQRMREQLAADEAVGSGPVGETCGFWNNAKS